MGTSRNGAGSCPQLSRRFRLRKCAIGRICVGGGPGSARNATCCTSRDAAISALSPEASPQWVPRPERPSRLFPVFSDLAVFKGRLPREIRHMLAKVLTEDMAGVHIGCLSEVNPLSPLTYSSGPAKLGDSSPAGCVISSFPPPPSAPNLFALHGWRDYVSGPIEHGSRPHSPLRTFDGGQRLTPQFTSHEIRSGVD